MIAGCYNDDTIRVWDVTTGICIQTLICHTDAGFYSIAWSPDSRYIASGSDDKTLRIWDATTVKLDHTNWVNAVSWSPDSTMLLSCSDDKTIKIWHTIDKKLESTLKRVSWEQTLVLIHIINASKNQEDIDFAQDKKALQCYNSLDQQVKQLVEPLLSERTRNTLH